MFPSSLKQNGTPRRPDSLNATQQKLGSQPIFLQVEEELHDARRVRSHGQEDDLRQALGMVIDRVGELSVLLSEAYKSQAELEVQLNVAKSNLQLVMSNNEMLEEELKRNSGVGVGWRRFSSEERSSSVDLQRQPSRRDSSASNSPQHSPNPVNPANIPIPQTPISQPQPQEGNRLLSRFKLTSGSRPSSRPETPNPAHHLSSPSMPTLPSQSQPSLMLPDFQSELEKERNAHQAALKEKAALEAELETLSQALFEEANKMVATERMKSFDIEEELREVKEEKDALKSALRLVEEEIQALRLRGSRHPSPSPSPSPSTSSSEIAIKSLPSTSDEENEANETVREVRIPRDSQATASEEEVIRAATALSSPSESGEKQVAPNPTSLSSEEEVSRSLQPPDPEYILTIVPSPSPAPEKPLSAPPIIPDEPSPWADIPSSSASTSPSEAPSSTFAAAAFHALR